MNYTNLPKIRSLLCLFGLVLLITSCHPTIRTDTVVHYNKFKEHTTVQNNNNWIHDVVGCKELAFNFFTLYRDKDEQPLIPCLHPCLIQIDTRSKTLMSISKGCRLWILADDKKIDIPCESFTGTKNTSVTSTAGYYSGNVYMPGVTRTDVEYHGTACFWTDLKTIREMAKAETITFEIETDSTSVIQGVFGEKNHISLRNFVQKSNDFHQF